jgi:hypothetical protein
MITDWLSKTQVHHLEIGSVVQLFEYRRESDDYLRLDIYPVILTQRDTAGGSISNISYEFDFVKPPIGESEGVVGVILPFDLYGQEIHAGWGVRYM